jgi:hypothetical protein
MLLCEMKKNFNQLKQTKKNDCKAREKINYFT